MKEVLAARRRRTVPLKNIPQEINILGENVRLFETKAFTGRTGTVSFHREYFPDADEEKLDAARKVFAAVFREGSMFSLQTPLYPCNEQERELLKEGLVRRFYGLRATVLEFIDIQDRRILEKKEAYEHLMRLKDLIETMEKIYTENAGACLENYDPRTGKFKTAMRLEDQEALRSLFRQFAFLVLQGSQPLEGWEDYEATDPVEFLDMLKAKSISKEDMERYLAQRNKSEGFSRIPMFLDQLLTDTRSLEMGVSAEIDKRLDEIYSYLKRLYTPIDSAEVGRIDASEGTLQDKIQRMIQSIFTKYEELLFKYNELQKKLQELQKQLDDCHKALKKCNENLAEIQPKISQSETQIAIQESRIKRLQDETVPASTSQQPPPGGPQAVALLDQIAIQQEALQALRSQKELSEADMADVEQRKQALLADKQSAEEAYNKLKAEFSRVSGELAEAVETLRARETSLNALKEERETAETQLKGLRTGLAEAEAAVASAQEKGKAEIAALKSQLVEKDAEMTRRIAELQGQAAAQIATQREAVTIGAQSLRQVEKQSRASDENVASLEDQLKAVEGRITAKTAEKVRLDGELKGLQPQVEGLLKQLAEQKARRRALPSDSDEGRGIQSAIDDLKRRIVDAQADVGRARTEFERATTELTGLTELRRTLGANLEGAKEKDAEVKKMVEGLRSALATEQEKFKQLLESVAAQKATHQKEIDAMKAQQLAELGKKEAELATKLRSLKAASEAEIDRARAELRDAKRRFEDEKGALQTRIANVQRDLARQAADHAEALRQQKVKAEGAISELKGQLAKMTSAKAEVEGQLNEQKLLVAAKAKEITALTAEKAALQTQVDTLKKTLDAERETNKTAIDELNAEIAEKDAEIAAKQDQITAAEARATALEGQVRDAANIIAGLNDNITAVDAQVDEIRAANRQLQERYNVDTGALREQVADATQELETTGRDLAAATAAAADLAAARDELVATRDTLQEQLQTQQAAAAEAATGREQAAAEAEQLRGRLEQMNRALAVAKAKAAEAAAERAAAARAEAAAAEAVSVLSKGEDMGGPRGENAEDPGAPFAPAAAPFAPAAAPRPGFRTAAAVTKLQRRFRAKRAAAFRQPVPEPAPEPAPAPAEPLRESQQLFEEEEQPLAPSANVFGDAETPAVSTGRQAPDAKDYSRLGVTAKTPLPQVVAAFQKRAAAVHPKRVDGGNYDEFTNIIRSYMRIRAFQKRRPLPTEDVIQKIVQPFAPAKLSVRQRKTLRNKRAGFEAAESGAARPAPAPAGVGNTTRRKRARRAAAYNAAVGTANTVDPVAPAVPETGAQKRARWNRLSRGQGTPENLAIQSAAVAASS